MASTMEAEGRPAGVGRLGRARRHLVPEARDGEVDHRRVHRRHVVVAQAEALDRPRPGSSRPRRRSAAPDCSTRSRPAGCLRSITTERLDRLLRRKVAPTARPSGSVMRRRGAASEVARARRLDLDHLGAEPPEELGGVGQRLHLLEGEHADAVERLAPVRRFRVDDVAEFHGPSRPSIAMALPRMIRYTSSSERCRTISSATARVSGQVESVWG